MQRTRRFLNTLLVLGAFAGSVCFAADGKKPAADAVTGKAGETVEFVYRKTDAKDLKVLVTFPADWKATDKRPGMVFFFGGGWTKGQPKQFEPQADYFASRGLVTVRADYTLGKGPAVCVDDAHAAMRWTRAHAAQLGIDGDKIISSGGSAGGHLAACVGVTDQPEKGADGKPISSRSNAMVLYNPVLDMVSLALKDLAGADKAKKEAISPIHHLQKASPPTIIFFGTADKLLAHGTAYLAKAQELGCPVEMFTAADQPHGFFNRSPWQQATSYQADRFLTKLGYLKGDPTVNVPANAKLSAAAPAIK